MTRNERGALTAQLARRLDERPDIPPGQAPMSLMRPAMQAGEHPCYLGEKLRGFFC